jgi:hypothetical protein
VNQYPKSISGRLVECSCSFRRYKILSRELSEILKVKDEQVESAEKLIERQLENLQMASILHITKK